MKKRYAKATAAVAAAAAIAAPAALAKFPDYGPSPQPVIVRPTLIRPVVARQRGFAWGDAAVGAGVAVGAVLVVGGSRRLLRRDGDTNPVLD